jgi:multiple sugar transport system permease protein
MTPGTLHKSGDLSERSLGAILLAPAALLLLVIVVYPVATLLWNSLHTVDPENAVAGETFAGLANYARAFDDERFWHSTWNTVLYVVVTVPGSLVVGLGLALLANKPFTVKWPVRLGLLLPWALPLVFAGLIFRWFFEYNTGVVNNWLIALGLAPLQWLSSPTLAFWAISIAIIWKASSFMALMLLAGLQTIPNSLYEAAEVDGASTWQQFVEITLPMLRPAILSRSSSARSPRCRRSTSHSR